MKDKDRLSPEVIYGLVADVGFRRHFHPGGLEATRELVELCHIDKDKYVETLSLPKNLLEYFGYGIYVGRK